MHYPSLDAFLQNARRTPLQGPVAAIFVEDAIEVGSTLSWALDLGFRQVLALMPDTLSLPDALSDRITSITFSSGPDDAVPKAMNRLIAAVPPGTWFYYGYNAEYLFFPFCETRSVGELLRFHAEERRDAMLTYVIDLYAGDLTAHPDGVSLTDAHLDGSGYYAQARTDPQTDQPLERQFDFHGGLRWRFEEHVPSNRRRIDRFSLFRADKGLELLADHRFNISEYNTYSCPWHHNLTAAVCSFRAAKSLRRNPGSRFAIDGFRWPNSVRFDWSSRQLLDLGLIEPGQWF